MEKITLKNKVVSNEDMDSLAGVLDTHTSLQGKYLQFDSGVRGLCFFPKKAENVEVIKNVLDKYGVKCEIRPFTSNNGKTTKIIRIIFDDVNNTNHTNEYVRFVGNAVKRMGAIKKEHLNAGKAATQEKIQKIFPFIRWFRKKEANK